MKPISERYSLGDLIGRGGVGEVYEGCQTALQRPVAIKLLREELTRNTAAVARFEREAKTTSLLNHPNVVTVFDVGTTSDGRRFVVMERLTGQTLGDLLDHRGALPPAEAIQIAHQIVRGMGAGQGVGLVHRDLKPDNVFISDGHVKILDFGLAVLLEGSAHAVASVVGSAPEADESQQGASTTYDPGLDAEVESEPSPSSRLTRPGALMGTPRYMAPEQVLGWGVDHRTDLYSFGVILFELLTGATPFSGPSAREFMHQHLHTIPPNLADIAPTLPPGIVQIVQRLLEKSPGDRFPDWSAVAEALRRIDHLQTSAIEPAPGHHAPPESRPSEPFRFLSPFTRSTGGIFFGREPDASRFRSLWDHPDRPRIVMLTGASGVGKTSFLEARVIPGLEDTGHTVIRVRGSAAPLSLVAREAAHALGQTDWRERPLADLLDELNRQLGRPVAIILDQVEEVLTANNADATTSLQAGLASTIGGSDSRIRFVLSTREDYLGAMLRALYPLPVDELARTLPLRPLEADDLADALVGPSRSGLAVDYAPFDFEPGLVREIVQDLLADTAGEVAPRVQAVGARLWEMVRDAPAPRTITRQHYRQGLGGARGILARILDEAIGGLAPADQGVAKELLRAMTHLPGSATSRPVPEVELVSFAADGDRRLSILRELEGRWRVLQGYQDPRWPDDRTVRIAHEALIRRIQDYGEEGSERNRARQVFHQGLSLWLQSGRSEVYLLPEQHFDTVQQSVEDLVLRTADEQTFYERSLRRHNEGWMARHLESRRRNLLRNLQFTLIPAALLAAGIALGQAAVDFESFRLIGIWARSQMGLPSADLQGVRLIRADLSGLDLRGANLASADLRDSDLSNTDLRRANLTSARLSGANLRGAQLKAATLEPLSWQGVHLNGANLCKANLLGDLSLAEFDGSTFCQGTIWPDDAPPQGAIGPMGKADGVSASGISLVEYDLQHLSARNARLSGFELMNGSLFKANLSGSDLSGARLTKVGAQAANFQGADLSGATLDEVDLTGANLSDANLCGTDLTRVVLRKTSLDGIRTCPDTRWPSGTELPAD